MRKTETAEPTANKLSGHADKTVDVICEECEILKRLDREALMAFALPIIAIPFLEHPRML